jgi:hypothetical protein
VCVSLWCVGACGFCFVFGTGPAGRGTDGSGLVRRRFGCAVAYGRVAQVVRARP